MIRPRPMAQKIGHYHRMYQLGTLPGCLFLHGEAKRRILAECRLRPLPEELLEARRWARDKVLSAYRIPAILIRGRDATAYDDLLDAFNYAIAGLPKHDGLPIVGALDTEYGPMPVRAAPWLPEHVIVIDPAEHSEL